MKSHIGLLRGINVSGANRILMADLRSLCTGLGWEDVQSYIQSGNLVFRAKASPAQLELALEKAISETFGLNIPVVVRTADRWAAYTAANPFHPVSDEDARFVHLLLSKQTPAADFAQTIQDRAQHGEVVRVFEDALWIHYVGGVARSKLTPALLDRLVGSRVTGRNWRTVIRITDMLPQG